MAIDIVITSDTGDAEKGVKNLGDSLEKVADNFDDVSDSAKNAGKDVEDSLKNVGDTAEDAGDKLKDSLGDGVKDGAKDVSRSLEKVEDSLEEVSDKGKDLDRDLTQALQSIDDQGSKTGKGIGDGIKRGTDQGKSSFKELGQEANSSAEEAASSFDGSAEGLIDTFREIAAEGGTSFGLLGGAIGLGLAAGIGIALAEMQKLGEANTEAAQNVADLASEFSDLGGNIDALNIGKRIQEWGREVNEDNWMTFWVDEAETNFQKYAEMAEDAGVTVKDTFKGLKGSIEDSQGFLDGTIEEFERLEEVIADNTTVGTDGAVVITEYGEAAQKQKDKLAELREGAQENIDTQKEAIDVYGIEQEAISGTTAATEAKTEALNATIEAQNTLAEANKSLIETEIATIEAFNGLTTSLTENGATLDLNTEAGRNNAGSVIDLIDSINAQAQAEVDAGGSVDVATEKMRNQRDTLVNQLMPAFGGSREKAQAYIDKMLQIPKTVNTDVNLDGIPDAQQQLNSFTSQRPTISVSAQLSVDRQNAYNQLYGSFGGHSFAVNMVPRGGNTALP